MKIDVSGMALIGGVLIGILAFALGISFPNQEPTSETDLNYFEERFNRVEIGIINSSVEICSNNNGSWLVDANRNLIKVPFNENYDNFPCLVQKN